MRKDHVKRAMKLRSDNRFSNQVLKYPVKETSKVTGTVHYVGSGTDSLSIFTFENASKYVHQDALLEGAHSILSELEDLEKEGLISNLRTQYWGPEVRRFSFQYNNQNKQLVEFAGKRYGDSGRVVPRDSQDNLEAILMKGMTSAAIHRAALIKLLPYLKRGGVIIDSHLPDSIYNPGEHQDDSVWGELRARTSIAGLDRIASSEGIHYIKRRHRSEPQLRKELNYNLDQYIWDTRSRESDDTSSETVVTILPDGRLAQVERDPSAKDAIQRAKEQYRRNKK